MGAKGLDEDGFIAREGALGQVPEGFVPVVDAARERIARVFDSSRLHSAYLYGSVPRGTAIPAVSDLDVLLALHGEPTGADRADADVLEAALDSAFEQVNGVGILLFSTRTLLSDLERHDLGWFVACLCTPLLGDDLADELPRYRPTPLLARETNGDLDLALPHWRKQEAAASTDAGRSTLSRAVARRIVRTGFTLVMPRWGGWTSDLAESAEAFGRYYPQRAAQMHLAATTARTPTADSAVLSVLIDDLGPWLAAEYTAVHGEKDTADMRARPTSCWGLERGVWSGSGGPGQG
ncbi:nucleotidyltransferase [Streptacidiphilus sp. PAMC 29251]